MSARLPAGVVVDADDADVADPWSSLGVERSANTLSFISDVQSAVAQIEQRLASSDNLEPSSDSAPTGMSSSSAALATVFASSSTHIDDSASTSTAALVTEKVRQFESEGPLAIKMYPVETSSAPAPPPPPPAQATSLHTHGEENSGITEQSATESNEKNPSVPPDKGLATVETRDSAEGVFRAGINKQSVPHPAVGELSRAETSLPETIPPSEPIADAVERFESGADLDVPIVERIVIDASPIASTVEKFEKPAEPVFERTEDVDHESGPIAPVVQQFETPARVEKRPAESVDPNVVPIAPVVEQFDRPTQVLVHRKEEVPSSATSIEPTLLQFEGPSDTELVGNELAAASSEQIASTIQYFDVEHEHPAPSKEQVATRAAPIAPTVDHFENSAERDIRSEEHIVNHSLVSTAVESFEAAEEVEHHERAGLKWDEGQVPLDLPQQTPPSELFPEAKPSPGRDDGRMAATMGGITTRNANGTGDTFSNLLRPKPAENKAENINETEWLSPSSEDPDIVPLGEPAENVKDTELNPAFDDAKTVSDAEMRDRDDLHAENSSTEEELSNQPSTICSARQDVPQEQTPQLMVTGQLMKVGYAVEQPTVEHFAAIVEPSLDPAAVNSGETEECKDSSDTQEESAGIRTPTTVESSLEPAAVNSGETEESKDSSVTQEDSAVVCAPATVESSLEPAAVNSGETEESKDSSVTQEDSAVVRAPATVESSLEPAAVNSGETKETKNSTLTLEESVGIRAPATVESSLEPAAVNSGETEETKGSSDTQEESAGIRTPTTVESSLEPAAVNSGETEESKDSSVTQEDSAVVRAPATVESSLEPAAVNSGETEESNETPVALGDSIVEHVATTVEPSIQCVTVDSGETEESKDTSFTQEGPSMKYVTALDQAAPASSTVESGKTGESVGASVFQDLTGEHATTRIAFSTESAAVDGSETEEPRTTSVVQVFSPMEHVVSCVDPPLASAAAGSGKTEEHMDISPVRKDSTREQATVDEHVQESARVNNSEAEESEDTSVIHGDPATGLVPVTVATSYESSGESSGEAEKSEGTSSAREHWTAEGEESSQKATTLGSNESEVLEDASVTEEPFTNKTGRTIAAASTGHAVDRCPSPEELESESEPRAVRSPDPASRDTETQAGGDAEEGDAYEQEHAPSDASGVSMPVARSEQDRQALNSHEADAEQALRSAYADKNIPLAGMPQLRTAESHSVDSAEAKPQQTGDLVSSLDDGLTKFSDEKPPSLFETGGEYDPRSREPNRQGNEITSMKRDWNNEECVIRRLASSAQTQEEKVEDSSPSSPGATSLTQVTDAAADHTLQSSRFQGSNMDVCIDPAAVELIDDKALEKAAELVAELETNLASRYAAQEAGPGQEQNPPVREAGGLGLKRTHAKDAVPVVTGNDGETTVTKTSRIPSDDEDISPNRLPKDRVGRKAEYSSLDSIKKETVTSEQSVGTETSVAPRLQSQDRDRTVHTGLGSDPSLVGASDVKDAQGEKPAIVDSPAVLEARARKTDGTSKLDASAHSVKQGKRAMEMQSVAAFAASKPVLSPEVAAGQSKLPSALSGQAGDDEGISTKLAEESTWSDATPTYGKVQGEAIVDAIPTEVRVTQPEDAGTSGDLDSSAMSSLPRRTERENHFRADFPAENQKAAKTYGHGVFPVPGSRDGEDSVHMQGMPGESIQLTHERESHRPRATDAPLHDDSEEKNSSAAVEANHQAVGIDHRQLGVTPEKRVVAHRAELWSPMTPAAHSPAAGGRTPRWPVSSRVESAKLFFKGVAGKSNRDSRKSVPGAGTGMQVKPARGDATAGMRRSTLSPDEFSTARRRVQSPGREGVTRSPTRRSSSATRASRAARPAQDSSSRASSAQPQRTTFVRTTFTKLPRVAELSSNEKNASSEPRRRLPRVATFSGTVPRRRSTPSGTTPVRRTPGVSGSPMTPRSAAAQASPNNVGGDRQTAPLGAAHGSRTGVPPLRRTLSFTHGRRQSPSKSPASSGPPSATSSVGSSASGLSSRQQLKEVSGVPGGRRVDRRVSLSMSDASSARPPVMRIPKHKPTVPQPFHLTGLELHEKSQHQIELARKKADAMEKRGRAFKARPMPDFSNPHPKPYV